MDHQYMVNLSFFHSVSSISFTTHLHRCDEIIDFIFDELFHGRFPKAKVSQVTQDEAPVFAPQLPLGHYDTWRKIIVLIITSIFERHPKIRFGLLSPLAGE